MTRWCRNVPMNFSLPFDLQRRLDDELDSSERLLWAGQPDPGRMARQGGCLAAFGIPWTLFAVFWTVTASGIGGIISSGFPGGSRGPGALFGLFGLPFIAVGLGLLTAPFWMARRARRTIYAVTDKRALIIEGGFGGSFSVRSLAPPLLADRARNQRSDDSGDLVFTRTRQVTWQNTSDGPRSNTSVAGFYAVADVKHVDDLIQDTFEKNG